ncbi:hypothetical protein SUGI_0839910 [Cryptomeria japonica]|uniref:uncharacterized protein LOC131028593 n=1 Tax=Cryptomeria japonica TaxID=3369 RepID=UPI002414A1E3|nr:uncharacterized protein LOC131028593 [Cryptomeria japonica]GLJ40677.1 hypothetical protein SUGI_0839910 [Cryptomeria japonica]
MNGGRRNRSRKGGPRWTRSCPPKTTAMWIPVVPSWEKEFCKHSVSLPWKEFCEVKKYTNLFPEIENWNDSAAEEAFHLAKSRYFAQINGTPCDIPEVDPNVYIDVVDWDSVDFGDVDRLEGYGSDLENEENCDTGMENLPNLYQDITTSEKERYEENKSQWKERPFGYGHIYIPKIEETRTVMCKVVDLYTAEPQLLYHWKVDLWSESFRMSMLHAVKNDFGASGWGSEFENEKEIICH